MDSQLMPPLRRGEDAKAWFYLEHRRDIEAWAVLRQDAAAVVHDWLLALGPAVQVMADELGCEYEEVDLEDGPFPRFGLWRPAWQPGGGHDLSVVIEWERDALLTPGPNCWPFVAVRSEQSKADKDRWRQLTFALTAPRVNLRAERDKPWPLWRYEQPAVNAPGVDPGILADGLLTSLRQVWEVCAPILDDLDATYPGVEKGGHADF